MYIAERRQSNSTRLVGLVGAAAVMAAVGLGLVAMRQTVVAMVMPDPIYVPMDPPTPVFEEPAAPMGPIDATITQRPITLPPIDITFDRDTGKDAPPIPPGDGKAIGPETAPTSTPLPSAAVIEWPKLNAGAKPDYPGSAIRAREQGTTTLNICVSKAGRVTSASVANSSGSQALDQAALSWIKREHFKPGTENGQPTDMCNRTIAYVWQLPKN